MTLSPPTVKIRQLDEHHPGVAPWRITRQAQKPVPQDRLRRWHFASLVVGTGCEPATFGSEPMALFPFHGSTPPRQPGGVTRPSVVR
jgi:hypothetical protein